MEAQKNRQQQSMQIRLLNQVLLLSHLIKYTWANQLANRVMLLLQTYMQNLLVPQLIIQAQKQSMSIVNKLVLSVSVGGAGFALSAAAVDTRIKSVVTISMYDMTDIREMANLAPEQLFQLKDQLSKQRWDDFKNGQPDYHPSFPEEPYDSIDDLPNHDELTNEWLRFYALKCGFHPNARGTATTTSNLAMLEFSALDYIKEISPRPILFVYGDNAHSRSYSERVYYLANQPKQKLIVEDCEHIDLYDNPEKIPVDQIAKFIKDSFNA